MGNCFTRQPKLHSKRSIKQAESIINTDGSIGGFEYSDAYLHDNDARFVFNFVRSAMNSGCAAANYVESLGGRREDGVWKVRARDTIEGREFEIHAKALVNAAGPFVDEHNGLTDVKTQHSHALSKGVHLIVNQLTPDKRVLAFFADDGRLFFVIPMGNRTCIGTTDTRVDSPHVKATDEDIDFILDNINKRLTLDKELTRDDVIAMRWGVRPLAVKADSGSDRDFLQLSRKHEIDADIQNTHVSIYGGKLTDCLNVGDEVCGHVQNMGIEVPHADYTWYGEPPQSVRDEFFHQAKLMKLDGYTSSHASEALSTRLWRRYGGQAIGLLENIREDPKQAEVLIENTEYLRCEIRQAARREMITKLEDFLRRRSKVSLVVRETDIRRSDGLMEACRILFGDQARAKFDEYFNEQQSEAAAGETAATLEVEDASNESAADNAAASKALNW